jgi:hypothetical protein
MINRIPILGIFMLIATTVAAGQQEATAPKCPPELVCISREAALKALSDAEKVKQFEAERAAYEKAIADLKDALADLRAEFARASGENSILKQRAVSDAALIELLVKQARPKRIGLINLF